MLTLNKAKRLACDTVAAAGASPRDELRVLDELTECRRMGWIFYFAARGPAVVTHGGEVYALDGARPAAEVLRELEARLAARRRKA
jgi:hypothetical protein